MYTKLHPVPAQGCVKSEVAFSLQEDKAGCKPWEAEQLPALGFPGRLSIPSEQAETIPCMAQELELQAQRLEEQHSLQAYDR